MSLRGNACDEFCRSRTAASASWAAASVFCFEFDHLWFGFETGLYCDPRSCARQLTVLLIGVLCSGRFALCVCASLSALSTLQSRGAETVHMFSAFSLAAVN